jgi:STE24 endopeptidase
VHRLKLPFAVLAAVVVAEAAVLLLRPRDGVIDPVEVDPEGYFSAGQIERAEDFRSGQLGLFGLRVAIELGVLVLLVRRPPARLGNARRPVLMGAAAGAALSLVTNLVPLPVSAVARQRAVDVGLVTQSWTGWAGDLALSWTIAAVIAAAGGAVAVVLLRRRHWWLPASVVVVAFGAAITTLSPIVLDPLFNRFEPLPEGRALQDVVELARRAGVDVGEVYVMDASRRTTAANAYVAGLGRTKRVVLYDTLLENFTPDEVNLVVAHELAHVHYDDVPNGLLFLAIVAPVGMFAVSRLAAGWAPRDAGPAAAIPALALALAIVVPLVTSISNQLSRDVEARADSYSLELTGAAGAFIGFERRIALRNVSDPDPPAWRTWLLATHPSTIDRIGIAEAYRRGGR